MNGLDVPGTICPSTGFGCNEVIYLLYRRDLPTHVSSEAPPLLRSCMIYTFQLGLLQRESKVILSIVRFISRVLIDEMSGVYGII